jgi:antitoxin (DNA-binding transcriptional repressor) of toxin-antitoxin stability system
MSTVTIEEAQAKLLDLIHTLEPHEEVVIIENNQLVARLIPVHSPVSRKARQPGTLRGTVKHMAPDFNAPLEDFKGYLE